MWLGFSWTQILEEGSSVEYSSILSPEEVNARAILLPSWKDRDANFEDEIFIRGFLYLSLSSPPSLSLSSSLSFRANWAVRPFAFSATARPPQAEPISAVGTIGSASVSPSRPDRPQPRGRPELAGKPCFPTEVPSKPPETSSSKFSFVSPPNRSSKAPGARQDCKRDLQRVKAVEVRGIHHRANYSFRTKVEGDSVEISAEV
ncbi:hypothetical protein Prudu_012845 [Prunus dulcis]|uniref:Uncharacterized protein n=1 Tax=Prunus dulcis TaxID=3755 RepID=A0A4Y1RDU2_PRUDU|nr:hypothetical protein Prudu_012845 [Prunus dulcis]